MTPALRPATTASNCGRLAHAFRRWVIESASVQRWLRYSFTAAFAGLGVRLADGER